MSIEKIELNENESNEIKRVIDKYLNNPKYGKDYVINRLFEFFLGYSIEGKDPENIIIKC